MEVWKCGSVQVCKCASVQVCKCGSVQVCKCASVQVCKCAVFKCASVQVWKCAVCKCSSVQVCTHQEETETAHQKRGMRDGVFVPQISLCIVLFYFFFCTFSLKSDFLKVDSGFRTSLPMHGTTKSAISSISDFAAPENTKKTTQGQKRGQGQNHKEHFP